MTKHQAAMHVAENDRTKSGKNAIFALNHSSKWGSRQGALSLIGEYKNDYMMAYGG